MLVYGIPSATFENKSIKNKIYEPSRKQLKESNDQTAKSSKPSHSKCARARARARPPGRRKQKGEEVPSDGPRDSWRKRRFRFRTWPRPLPKTRRLGSSGIAWKAVSFTALFRSLDSAEVNKVGEESPWRSWDDEPRSRNCASPSIVSVDMRVAALSCLRMSRPDRRSFFAAANVCSVANGPHALEPATPSVNDTLVWHCKYLRILLPRVEISLWTNQRNQMGHRKIMPKVYDGWEPWEVSRSFSLFVS